MFASNNQNIMISMAQLAPHMKTCNGVMLDGGAGNWPAKFFLDYYNTNAGYTTAYPFNIPGR
ncbi:MAG: hypothetical protein ACE15C_01035 [Phycisphaerae bacterium]